MVEEKAAELTFEQQKLIGAGEETKIEVKAIKAEIYEAEAEEVIFLGDGICVSEQKAERDKQPKVRI